MNGRDDSDMKHPQRRSEAFFGRRKGQKLHRGHQRLMDTRLPELLIDLDASPPQELTALFSLPAKSQVQLEIGFGGGEHIIQQALDNPDIGYIGVEPFVNGMAKAVAAIERYDLKNIRLYDDDATQLLDWIPAACLSRLYLLYPDPWPKRRHWKRRFVNQRNLERFFTTLKPGAEFRFATDIETYQNWTLQQIDFQNRFQWTAQSSKDWLQPWDNWVQTRYEAKAIREGRRPGYFRFTKNGTSLR